MTLGTTIARLREERGWDQGRLAANAEIGQSHLSQIESSGVKNPGSHTIARIAKVLQVSTDYLFEEAGWLPPTKGLGQLSSSERKLILTIRSVVTPRIRHMVLEQLNWIASVARDADRQRGTL